MEKQLKVIYIGNDLEYWKEIIHGYKAFPSVSPVFSRIPLDECFHPPEIFVSIHNHGHDIIYVDLATEVSKGLSLIKLLCRNNVTRLKSVVGLHSASENGEGLVKSILAGARLNYLKGVEKEDVVYHPLSLLDASLRPAEVYAQGGELSTFLFKQILRIGYVAHDMFRVETGAPLPNGEFVKLDRHPLEGVMPERRFFVEKFSDSDLYYNQRYSYHLKFTYLDNEFMRESEKTWLAYKEEVARTGRIPNEKREKVLYGDVARRREIIAPVKDDIIEWIDANKSLQAPKRLKVLVVDESLEIFREHNGNLDNFNYTISFQTRLTKDFYQIRRSRPHLIVFHHNPEGNNEEVLAHVVKEVKKFENYEPPILVFNSEFSSDTLRRKHQYAHLAGHKDKVNLDIIRKMSEILDDRFHITDPEGKVFLKTEDPRSVATLTRAAKIQKFNESEMWFESETEIPMWSSFVMEAPLAALITVLPMRDGPAFQKQNGAFVYRALINGVGEKEKARLRRLVNASLKSQANRKKA